MNEVIAQTEPTPVAAPDAATSGPSLTPTPAATAIVTAPEPGWDKVRHWMDWAEKFGRGKLACQIMAGFELLALHAKHEIRVGQYQKVNCQNDKSVFGELLTKELKIASKTAYRWMTMARAVQAKYGDLTAPEQMRVLLGTSPKEWSAPDAQVVWTFVEESTNGKTAIEFMNELGGAPAPRSPAQAPATPPVATPEIAFAAAKAWRRLERCLVDYGQKFELLDEEMVEDQMDALICAAQTRHRWLEERKQKAA